MRLDKLLCELNIGSRSEVKEYIKKGQILVDGDVVKDSSLKVDENSVKVTFNAREYSFIKYRYFIMNKRPGIVSADTDRNDTTVMDDFRLLTNNEYKGYFPVGRLDKDTVGFLLITNDGALSHKLLSPKGHVDKEYEVIASAPVTSSIKEKLENGIEIQKDVITLPARVIIDENEDSRCHIIIHEGKFHQVKLMFEKCGLKVLHLKRIAFGPLVLDDTLLEGQIRECRSDEIELLYNCVK